MITLHSPPFGCRFDPVFFFYRSALASVSLAQRNSPSGPSAARTRRLSLAQRELALSLAQRLGKHHFGSPTSPPRPHTVRIILFTSLPSTHDGHGAAERYSQLRYSQLTTERRITSCASPSSSRRLPRRRCAPPSSAPGTSPTRTRRGTTAAAPRASASAGSSSLVSPRLCGRLRIKRP